jgi:hypothetical protein
MQSCSYWSWRPRTASKTGKLRRTVEGRQAQSSFCEGMAASFTPIFLRGTDPSNRVNPVHALLQPLRPGMGRGRSSSFGSCGTSDSDLFLLMRLYLLYPFAMQIGQRLRELREARKFSQGD